MVILIQALGAVLCLGLAKPVAASSCAPGPLQDKYKVTVQERDAVPDDAALISKVNGSSVFNFNFATAWFPTPGHPGDGLIVRVVECNPDHHACPNATHPEWTNAGALTAVHATLSDDKVNAQFISESNVFWAGVSPPPRANHSLWGAADPRIAYRKADSTYYLTWDNCTQNCYPTRSTLLSTTKNPFDHTSWTCHGPVLKNKYTGGASLLLRDEPPHYAFVGDSNTANIIMLATSQDGINWEESSKTFMEPRPDCWDAKGVAAGPQPELLSNGDYFYIYNIDTGFPYHPNPLGRCAIGWAILNGSDPTQIVARAEEVLLVPTFPWETCPEGKGRVCQEPMVVFSTGMKPLGDDTFLVLYGAADTDVGVAKVKVTIQ